MYHALLVAFFTSKRQKLFEKIKHKALKLIIYVKHFITLYIFIIE